MIAVSRAQQMRNFATLKLVGVPVAPVQHKEGARRHPIGVQEARREIGPSENVVAAQGLRRTAPPHTKMFATFRIV
jgi:hypothetical protein